MGNTQQQQQPPLSHGINLPSTETYDIDQDIKHKAYEIEKQLLQTHIPSLTANDIYYQDIPINFYGNNNYIHTLICNTTNTTTNTINPPIKEVIVMLHGYQGNSLSFYKLMPLISHKFISYAPDMIGMGLSSRPKVEFNSSFMCYEYFIESLEAWRKALHIEHFYLCGHSMGGFFASIYALKYPQYIKDLILLAPTCVTDTAIGGGDIHETVWWPQKVGFNLIKSFWTYQPRLQDISQHVLFKHIFNKALRIRYAISENENELLGQITELTMKYPKDTDQCIYYIFKHPFPSAQFPLEKDLEEQLQDKRILFIYGEKDWMEKIGAVRLCNKQPHRCLMFTISKYGHTFPLENPQEVADVINNNL